METNKECCKNCTLLRELILNKSGLPNYDDKRNCCILFTVIGDRKNDYSDTVYEINDPDTGMCECFTPKEDKYEKIDGDCRRE